MSVNSIICTAVTPIVPVCVPDVYRPLPNETPAVEYCTFNCSEIPDAFGDELPEAIRYLVQLHYFLPTGASPIAKKKQLKNALLNAGFTYPSVTNASDSDGQHIIFESEYCDGDI